MLSTGAALLVAGAVAVGQSSAVHSARAGQSRDGGAVLSASCARVSQPDAGGYYIAPVDFAPPVASVDGDDLLALVNRSPRWVLSPQYFPRDLVDARTARPSNLLSCLRADRQCLRRDSAVAFGAMVSSMRAAGHQAVLHSAFRGFSVQCDVFAKWAWRPPSAMGFCPATSASAIAGHSQHQLGTAVDVFTQAWAQGGPIFRDGFGCSAGGRWLQNNSWRFGFVLPYPLHPDYRRPGSDCLPRAEFRAAIDPRTGYKYEPWHLRYIGQAAAERFHQAWSASGPNSSSELTLEQWLRERLGARDVIEPPVCDGCACRDCATFASTASACGAQAMQLLPSGNIRESSQAPELLSVSVGREQQSLSVRAVIRVPSQTLTQPPIGVSDGGVYFEADASVRALQWREGALARDFRGLEGAWRLCVQRVGQSDWPWCASLASAARDTINNGVNSRILADTGEYAVGMRIAAVEPGARMRVGLVQGAQLTASTTHEVTAP